MFIFVHIFSVQATAKQLPSGIEDGHPNNLKMDIYNHLQKSIYGGLEGMVLDVFLTFPQQF